MDIDIIVIGSDGVGKTSLLISYYTNEFPVEYIPTILDPITLNLIHCGHPFNITCRDTPLENNCTWSNFGGYLVRQGKVYNNNTDIFLVCYSCVDPASYDAVTSLYMIELESYIGHGAPQPMVFLVATKQDLIEFCDAPPVTVSQGRALAKRIDAIFFECSALTFKGVRDIFDSAQNYVYKRQFKRRKSCYLM